MIHLTPGQMILIGIGLMLMGILFPFLMVMHVVKSSFALNFFSYGAQISGLFLGIIGAVTSFKQKKG